VTVAFEEFENSPQEHWGEDGYFQAKRRLLCAWSDRYSLLSYMATGGGRTYPYFKNVSVYSCGATIIPFNDEPSAGDDDGEISYGSAVVTITYALQPWYPRAINNFMVVEELNPFREYRTLPKAYCHVGSASGDAPKVDPRIMTGGLEYTLTFYDLSYATSAGLDMLYTCNQNLWATYLLGVYFNPEMLLLTNVAPRVQARMGETNKKVLTYQMWYRNVSWQKDLTENGWEYIYNDAGDLIVPTTDFNQLRP